MIGKRIKEKFGSGITLTKNEIENVIKVLNSFENREILLKETTRKNTSQEGGFLSFLGLLMTAGLSLKSVLTLLSKSILLPFELTPEMLATDHGSGTTALIVSKKGIEDIMKIFKSLEKSR